METAVDFRQWDSYQADVYQEARRRKRQRGNTAVPVPTHWRERIPAMFPAYFPYPFSEPHAELWRWAAEIEPDSTPRPFCAFWSRGRGKSTNAEAVACDLGARQKRTYGLYVCGTQDQADKHVQTIARMLESQNVTRYYPAVGEPRIGKNGSRTWNRRIVTAANGFTIEAVGLNKAVRGQKIDWARPDLIIFDDVDERHDSEATVEKKEAILTDSILPAGAVNCAVLFVQNLIHADSIARRLSRPSGQVDAAGFLMQRIISGPFPAVEGLRYESQQAGDIYHWRIVDGRSLWQGFDLEECENELNRVGPGPFEREYQHDVDGDDPNALMSQADFDRTRVTAVPDLVQVAVAVDPPGGATECGIVAGGKAKKERRAADGSLVTEWHGYTLEDASTAPGVKPETWALAVLQCCYRVGADVVFVERNYGGDMVKAVIQQTKWTDDEGNVILDGRMLKIQEVHATRGKQVRAEPVATVFQQGRGHHVGTLTKLEKEWRQWVPGDDSPNRLDAETWLYTGLGLLPVIPRRRVPSVSMSHAGIG